MSQGFPTAQPSNDVLLSLLPELCEMEQSGGGPQMRYREYRSSGTSAGEWFLLVFMLLLVFGGVAGFIWVVARRWF